MDLLSKHLELAGPEDYFRLFSGGFFPPICASVVLGSLLPGVYWGELLKEDEMQVSCCYSSSFKLLHQIWSCKVLLHCYIPYL